MIRIAMKCLAVAVLVAIVAPVLAQPGPFGQGQRMSAAVLLQNKSVQEELKLTADQVAEFKKIGEDVRGKFEADLKKAREDKNREKLQELFKAMSEESDKAIGKAVEGLKPEQKKRLHQIEVQVGGLGAFVKEDVQKSLKLSDKQVADIKALQDEVQKDVQEIMKGAGRDPEKRKEAQEKVAKLRKESLEKVTSGFSADQKAAYKDLVGEKFELKIEPRRPNP
jgi:Spy/CpxP family protein refolding chaperone